MTDEELQAARRERARRWATTDLRGYPALQADEETEETLAASPPEKLDKKPKAQASQES